MYIVRFNFHLDMIAHRIQKRQTFQQVSSLPESVFAFLADFPLASS